MPGKVRTAGVLCAVGGAGWLVNGLLSLVVYWLLWKRWGCRSPTPSQRTGKGKFGAGISSIPKTSV
jgi:hypothetical protein